MTFWQNRRRIATLRKGQHTTVTFRSNVYVVTKFNRFYISKLDSDWKINVKSVEEAIDAIHEESKQTV